MRELFPVSRDGVQSGDDVLVPVRHFDGVGNRPDSLLFEAGCTAIPEDAIRGLGQVDDTWRTPSPHLRLGAHAPCPAVGESHDRVVARGTADGAV